MASRGSSEVGSSILTHIKEMATDCSHLILYSDACGGKNCIINLVCLWLHIVASSEYSITKIDHKFMISGYSYLPIDKDFGNVEQAQKRAAHIYIPQDWMELVAQARRKNPFNVLTMKRENFCVFTASNKFYCQSQSEYSRWEGGVVEDPLDFCSQRPTTTVTIQVFNERFRMLENGRSTTQDKGAYCRYR